MQSIYVKNFILLDEVSLDFNQGMAAFIGETGAGKSLLMDAISILKGERVQTSMIQQGKEQAIVEGVFTYQPNSKTHQKLLEFELIDEDDEQLIVTRQWNRKGKSSVKLNHRTISVSILKEISENLLDIHSQHDVISLLHQKNHLQLLDSYINDDTLLQKVQSSWKSYQKIQKALYDIEHNGYQEDDLDYLTYQFNEINDANIQPNELEQLEEQLKEMQSFEKNQKNLQIAIQAIDDNSVLSSLYDAIHALSQLHILLENNYEEQLNDCYYNIEEILHQLKNTYSHLEFDESQYNQIQDRITTIRRLMRKYGNSEDALQQKKEQLEQAIDSIIHRSSLMTQYQKQCDDAHHQFLEVAHILRAKRLKVAQELEKLVLKQLHDLCLEHASFKIQFEEVEGHAKGIDQVSFYISMNKGETLKPLQNSASGGELSRFMLGMKAVFAHQQGIETIIFDEIDTGVSGSVAYRIGKKMQEIAQQIQVFAVTHLAPVAACADDIYYVEKNQSEEQTTTDITLCDESQTIVQLAMIASGTTSDAAIKAAQELRKKAKNESL